ncbi:hypothetical protein D3C74_442850 [compost metagenome]
MGCQLPFRERVELLQPEDMEPGPIPVPGGFKLGLQINGYLAAADHQSFHLGGLTAQQRLRQYRLEASGGKLGSG